VESLDTLTDEVEIRKAVIKKHGLDEIFGIMIRDYQDYVDSEDDDMNLRQSYQRVLDNFDVLMEEALEKI